MTTPEQWELGGKILDGGMAHPALAVIERAYEELGKALAEAQEASKGLKRVGAGRTEDPTLILARVVPALRDLSTESAAVAGQLEKRLG